MRVHLEHLDWVLTVDADDRVVRDATIVVDGDRISAVGTGAEVAASHPPAPGDERIDGRGLGATPGFVDTHVHLSETLSRAAFPDLLSTRAWVFHWIMPWYGALTAEDERVSVQVAAVEMLRRGTTCFLDMGALVDPAVTVAALAEIGIRGVTGRHAADVPPDPLPPEWPPETVERHFFPSAEVALEALEACVRSLDGAGDGRIRCWVNLQGKEPCSDALHVGARDLAERLGVGTTYHIASSIEEALGVERRHGLRPVARMASLGGLGSNLVLAHAVAVTDEEIGLMAEHGTKVAFCPGTSLKLAKGATAIGRYPEMIAAGVTVGLGTDGVSASGNLDLMRQMYLAAGLFKDARMDPEMVGARQALRMATIDGARALGWDDEMGSLEPGKQADLVLFDLSHVEWVPHGDPVQALVWSASPASIRETWVAGRRVYRDGRVTTIADQAALASEARERAAAIVRRAGLDRLDVVRTTSLYD
jgi:cytosine/adenosine deaminase-related metal-dependent hydrolase